MVRKQKEIYALVSLGKHYEIPLAVRQPHSWQVRVHKTIHFLTFFLIFQKYQRAELSRQDDLNSDLEEYITLIKKKIKFSSYIWKFRVEQLQSHI
jgi:hypothetical protein